MTPRSLSRKLTRHSRRTAGSLLLLCAALTVVLALPGCDPRQMAYFLQPFEPEIKAPGPDLKGKRVVAIAKGVPGALYDFPTLDRELTQQFVDLLRAKVKKVEIVALDKVYAWDQAHPSWSDPADLVDAFDADAAIYLEVHQFQIQDPSSPGLFEGHSSVHVRVVERDYPKDDRKRPMTDKPKENRIVFENERDTTFPTRGPLPASSDLTASTFKAKFLTLVATELSWFFVTHAPGDDIQDTRF